MAHRTLFAFTLIGALSFLAEPGICQNAPSIHEGPWPIENGVKRQPTPLGAGGELPNQDAGEVDRLYNELMSNYQSNHHTGIARKR